MKFILLFIYYLIIGSIYCFESILSFYILLQWAFLLFSVSEDSIFYKIYIFLNARIEPIFAYFRKFVPPVGGIDFSVLILFFGLDGIRRLISLLFTYMLGE